MKRAVLVLMAFCSVFMYSQNTKPTFEKEGEKVKATYFHDNGLIAQTGYMLNGKLHGDWTMFDAKGDKIAEGKYIEGKREGKWFFWKGTIVKEVDFVKSKIIAVNELSTADGITVN
jgi:antitoxin component YwqK of YwqJK toxin-antitoxin module